MFALLADYYAPLTDDMLCDATQDHEKVQTAYNIMMENIGNHFKSEHDVQTPEDFINDKKQIPEHDCHTGPEDGCRICQKFYDES